MSDRRVVITGTGWVTPLGSDVDAVWARLLAGDSGIGPITRYDASNYATDFASEVKGFDLVDYMGDEASKHQSAGISTRFALGAASNAWKQSGLGEHEGFDHGRLGIYLGAGEGSLDAEHFPAAILESWNPETRKVDPVAWARRAYAGMRAQWETEQEPHLTISHLSHAFDARGPAMNCMTACAAGAQCVGEASEIIRRGDADSMIAGGAHSMIHPLGMTGFVRLTAMSTRRDDPTGASRPFDSTRDGFVMGEGAGMLVLEELEHARARGANILAEIAGYGSTADAYRITDIQPDGLGGAGAMGLALKQAGIDPHETDENGRPGVHYINAHGTGTQENDKIETRAVKQVFGELAPKVPFSSIKSMLGHLIQAAGTVELIVCVQAIKTGMIPPTRNLVNADPNCDLDHVPGEARDMNGAGGGQRLPEQFLWVWWAERHGVCAKNRGLRAAFWCVQGTLSPEGLCGSTLAAQNFSLREESIMSSGRATRTKNKSAQKRQKVGSQAAYKKKLAAKRRKKSNLRVTTGNNN